MTVSDLQWVPGSSRLSWRCGEKEVARIFAAPLQDVCLLAEGDGIALVEGYQEAGPRNASIVNCDGTERVRLKLPMPIALVHGYDSIYYIQGKLSAILASTSGDWAVVVDPKTGELSELRESR